MAEHNEQVDEHAREFVLPKNQAPVWVMVQDNAAWITKDGRQVRSSAAGHAYPAVGKALSTYKRRRKPRWLNRLIGPRTHRSWGYVIQIESRLAWVDHRVAWPFYGNVRDLDWLGWNTP